jgi:hypothetical protein
MNTLTLTLVTDGSSDAVLLPILTWLLRVNGVTMPLNPMWADTRRAKLPRPPDLTARLRAALDLYPCDLLCIHRDAERQTREKRVEEIRQAIDRIRTETLTLPPFVCVVPVRMQEAWLLFDEHALKHAAGNSSFRGSLNLPPLSNLETLPDPKTVLHSCLQRASKLRGRRLDQFPVHKRTHRIAELIDDFSPLRALPAFQALEQEVQQVVAEAGWNR